MKKSAKIISIILSAVLLAGSPMETFLVRAEEPDIETQNAPLNISIKDDTETVYAGEKIVLTVEVTGGTGIYEYQFMDEENHVLQDYTEDNTFSFYAEEGDNTVIVHVADSKGATSSYKYERSVESAGEEVNEEEPNDKDVIQETENALIQNEIDDSTPNVSIQPKAQTQLQVQLNSSRTTNEYIDREVTLSGNVKGAQGTLVYRFTEIYNGKETIVQDYSVRSDYSFVTSGVGIHTFYLDVRDEAGNTARTSYTMNVVMHPAGVLTGKLTSNKTTNEYLQRDITLTAVSSGGYGEIEYRFTEVYNGKTTVIQDYSTEKVYSFRTSGEGVHTYYVDIRDTEGQNVRASFTMKVVMHPTAVLSGRLTSNKTANEYIDRDITLTAASKGGYGEVEYRFTEVYNGKSTVIQDYSPEKTYSFRTSGEGVHIYYVDIRDEEGQNVRVSYTLKVVMHPAGVLSGKLISNKTANEYIQRDVILTAVSSGGYGDVKYRFTEVYNGKTTVLQDYSTQKTYSFSTSGEGIHTYYVDIRDGEGQSVRASYTMKVVMHPTAVLSGKLTSNKTSNEYIQRDIILTAVSSGGYGEVEYRFTEVYSGKTTVVQDYSTKNTYSFSTSDPGSHVYYVDIRDEEGQSVKASYSINVIVHPSMVLSGKVTSNKTANEYIQREITLSATASGGYGELSYRFIEVYAGQTKTVQDYSEKSEYTFSTTGPGQHIYYVDIRDSEGQVLRLPYSLQVVVHPSCVLKGTFKSSPAGTATPGQSVTLTASSSGGYGSNHQYRFREAYNGKATVLQNYSSGKTCSFKISGGGTHTYYVDIKDSEGQILTLSLRINTSLAYTYATDVLNRVGWNLRAAFNWSASLPYQNYSNDPSPGSENMALYGFQNGRGDCYVMAATFYYMAKVLGYDAHQMAGYVPLLNGGRGVHSWVEIDMNGTTYVFDPDFTHETGRNGYQITYGTSGTWVYSGYYRMN